MPTDDGTENVTDVPGHGANLVAALLPALTATLTVTTEAVLVDTGPQPADTSQVTFSVAPESLLMARV